MFNDNDIVKIANLKYTFKEIKKEFFDNNNHYIIKYKTVYQIFYSQNAGFYANEIYYNRNSGSGYTLSGRHIFTNAEFANRLIGFNYIHTS